MTWGNYGVLVPYRNDLDTNYNARKQHGMLVRFNLTVFDAENLEVLDLTSISRKQIPSDYDRELRGYLNGFAWGTYVYLVPHFNSGFQGKFTRIDMRDFEELAANQKAGLATDIVTNPVANRGQYFGLYFGLQYDGVQYIDLQESDPMLVGFSGGFAGPGTEDCTLSGEKAGTTEECHFRVEDSFETTHWQAWRTQQVTWDGSDGGSYSELNYKHEHHMGMSRKLMEVCETGPYAYLHPRWQDGYSVAGADDVGDDDALGGLHLKCRKFWDGASGYTNIYGQQVYFDPFAQEYTSPREKINDFLKASFFVITPPYSPSAEPTKAPTGN